MAFIGGVWADRPRGEYVDCRELDRLRGAAYTFPRDDHADFTKRDKAFAKLETELEKARHAYFTRKGIPDPAIEILELEKEWLPPKLKKRC